MITAENISDPALLDQINGSKADFLLVALGAQKGQAWLMANRHKLTVPIVSHLGATLNFLAGTVRRAPAGLQRLGLEWLWRIAQEPYLAARYLMDGTHLCSSWQAGWCRLACGCAGLTEAALAGAPRVA